MNAEKTLKASFLRTNLAKYAIYLVLVVFCVALAIASPRFITEGNLMNVMRQVSINGIVAAGMLFTILTAGIDLSVGSIIAMAGAVTATFAHEGGSVLVAVLAGLVTGALVGAINGGIIALSGIAPFIATLGTQTIVSGAVLLYTDGHPVIDLSPEFNFIGGGFFLGIAVPIWILLLALLVAFYLLNFTKFGRHVLAVGGNPFSAEVSGVNVKKTLLLVYILSGILSALAAIVLTARVKSASPTAGKGYELDAIAACVIGGTSFMGGIGTVGGMIAGMLIIGVLTNGMNLLNISSYWQLIVKGLIIVLAVMMDKFMRRSK